MTHPTLFAMSRHPELFADHVEAYTELLSAEIGDILATWRRRTVLELAAISCAFVSAVLAGVAVMLWSVMPTVAIPALWSLILVPCLSAVAALWLWYLASGLPYCTNPLESVKRQFKADMALLREGTAP